MKKIVNVSLLVLILVMIFSTFYQANADSGVKPSITVRIDNIDTSNYIVELFVYEENPQTEGDVNGFGGNGLTELQNKYLYSLNYDGWVSESTRKYMVFSECQGNINHSNYFTYFDTPTIYRIYIMNCDTGEEKISDVIERKDFTSVVRVDFNDMTVKNGITSAARISTVLVDILGWAIPVIATFVIELIVYNFMFDVKNKNNIKVLFITNVITNLMLQVFERFIMYFGLIPFVVSEVLIVIVECIIYSTFIKEIEKNKIIKYTIIANIVSALLTFFPSFFLILADFSGVLKSLLIEML